MDGRPVDADAFGDQLQVRAGGASGTAVEGAQQRLDHPHRGGLAVRAGHVDGGEGALRGTQQVHEHLDALQRRVDLRLRPAFVELLLDLSQLSQVLRGDRALDGGVGVLAGVLPAAAEIERQAGFGDLHRTELKVGLIAVPVHPVLTDACGGQELLQVSDVVDLADPGQQLLVALFVPVLISHYFCSPSAVRRTVMRSTSSWATR